VRRATLLLLLAALILVSLVALSIASRRRPPSGLIEGRLRPCATGIDCLSSQAQESERRVPPLRIQGDPHDAFGSLVVRVAEWPRCELLHLEDTYAHFELVSLLLRLRGDLELQLDLQEGVIHLRAASRVGRSDLGTNRRRIERLRAELEEP